MEAVCEGSAKIAPLTSLSASLDEIAVQARQLDIGYELSGAVQGVDMSLPATHYLVPAAATGNGRGGAVPGRQASACPRPRRPTERWKGGAAPTSGWTQLSVPAGPASPRGAAVRDALVRADDAALLLTAADTVASLAALIQQTVNHLKERRQFGVTLSSFQVLRHRTADMYVRYLGAKGLLMHAFQEYERGAADLRRTLRLMKVALAESARLAPKARSRCMAAWA